MLQGLLIILLSASSFTLELSTKSEIVAIQLQLLQGWTQLHAEMYTNQEAEKQRALQGFSSVLIKTKHHKECWVLLAFYVQRNMKNPNFLCVELTKVKRHVYFTRIQLSSCEFHLSKWDESSETAMSYFELLLMTINAMLQTETNCNKKIFFNLKNHLFFDTNISCNKMGCNTTF